MTDVLTLRPIAHLRGGFPSKFGVPRQSGLVEEVTSRIVFTPEFRSVAAVRGLDGFSHLWLIWDFSLSHRDSWSATVRPPRLGGQERLGVFATRSPFRPNPLGLSSVRLVEVETDGPDAPVVVVAGADLVDGTPIYDIKPYVPTDAHPDATFGFVAANPEQPFAVADPSGLLERLPQPERAAVVGILRHDPRPRFLDDPARVYGLPYAGWDIRFRIVGRTLTVVDVAPLPDGPTDPAAVAQDRRGEWPGYR